MNQLTVAWDKPLDTLTVGQTRIATVKSNGVLVPHTTVCQWAKEAGKEALVDILQSTTVDGESRLVAKQTGSVIVIALTVVNGTVTGVSPQMTATIAAAPVATAAPLGQGTLNRSHISLHSTNFYYNWLKRVAGDTAPDAMEIEYAHRYDVMMSGDRDGRVQRLQQVNPHLKYVPYALLLSTVVTGDNIQTSFLPDFDKWCAAHGVTAAQKEAAFLHDSTGKRFTATVWGSPRNVGDPRNAVWRAYSIDRMKRVASDPKCAAVFLDEYGTGSLNTFFKTDSYNVSDLAAAETSLVRACRDALMALLPPKQLVANTAAYIFSWDEAIAKAALGIHMEQTNNPLHGDLVPTIWPWIEKMNAQGVWINMVPPFQFGEYESQVGKTGTQYMDTVRGKLLELASYYMVVPVNPAMLSLSIENSWKDTPIQNWIPALKVNIGHPTGARARNLLPVASVDATAATHTYARPFSNGLVLFHPIWNDVWNRAAQDFGAAVHVKLPTDRPYHRVNADGTVATSASTTVTLRTPEAAIFVCVP